MYRIIIVFFIIYYCNQLQAQSISSLETQGVVELECIQSSTTNAFIACSMERISSTPNREQTLIHRSIDNGISWELVATISPTSSEISIADPVITQDEMGYLYLTVMRIYSWSPSPGTIDLELYKSTDDGQTWNYISSPFVYDGTFTPDYPQIISKGNGKLFLVYMKGGIINGIVTKMIFVKSSDGGVTWSNPHEFDFPSTAFTPIGADISWGIDESMHVTFGGGIESNIYYYTSTDEGDSWTTYASSSSQTIGEITKPISHPDFEYIGVLSHRPHINDSPITYHSLIENEWSSFLLAEGAYAQGLITEDGIIHVTYNQQSGTNFTLNYVYSLDNGLSFSLPEVLYTASYTSTELGEYQSIINSIDGNFYLTFCDWGDNSRAKILVFSPYTYLTTSEHKLGSFNVHPNPSSGIITVSIDTNTSTNSISLMNTEGKILDKIFLVDNPSNLNFDLSQLSKGTYLILLEENNRYLVKRIIKE